MLQPDAIRITKVTMRQDEETSHLQRSVLAQNWAHLNDCIAIGEVLDRTEKQKSLVHHLAEASGERLQEMMKADRLAQYVDYKCFGPVRIPLFAEGIDEKLNSYMWILCEVNRTTALGLKPGMLLKIPDIPHIISYGENAFGDAQRALQQINPPLVRDATPLACAVIRGNFKSVEQLAPSSDLHAQDAGGNTLAMLATSIGRLDILQFLEESGAPLEGMNNQLKTVHDIARDNQHYAVMNYVFFKFSRLRANVKEWVSTHLNNAVAALLDTRNPTRCYYLEHITSLQWSIKHFLEENFEQDINFTSSPVSAVAHESGPESLPMRTTGGSYTDAVWEFVRHHAFPVKAWANDTMRGEHQLGVDMEQRIVSIMSSLQDAAMVLRASM